MPEIRKLAAASVGFSAAVFAAHYALPFEKLPLAAVICAAVCIAGLFLRGQMRRRVVIIALAAALGTITYYVHYLDTVLPTESLGGETVTVSARVTDYPEEHDYYRKIYVAFTDEKLLNIDGVLFDYADEQTDLAPGQKIEVAAKLRSADERYNEPTDINISKGLYLIGTVKGKIAVEGAWEGSWIYFPKDIGRALQGEIAELFPGDTGAFFLALLTGDKSELYSDDKLSCSMSVAGLSHVVAVSGMHIAFLVGFLQLVLGKSRRSSLFCIALIWVFVLMVGAPPSSVRAGVMQTMLLLAPVLRRENDALTSLSFALALILAFNPFAAGSIGLQLSFAAMAGILLFTEKIYDRMRCKVHTSSRFLSAAADYVFGVAASSLAVTVFTVPLVAVHFGYVSLFAPLANILCIWAVSLAFCGGYAACLAGALWPMLGKIAAALVSYLVRYIALVVEYIAKLPYAALYTKNSLVTVWLASTYLAFIVCLSGRRRKKRPLIPTAYAAASLAAVLIITNSAMLREEGTVTVLDVGSGQCIALMQGESTVVIDCGSSGTIENAGFTAASYLQAGGRRSVDILLLTHLHEDHASGAMRLMNLCEVGTLILPSNAADSDENALLEDLLSCAAENEVPVRYISVDADIFAGEISLSVYGPMEKGDRNERGLMLTAGVNGCDVLVTGDAAMSVERALVRKTDISDTDILIVGHHGSKYSTSAELLEAASPQEAVISVGYNSYGHPTPEVLGRLAEANIPVLRTDTAGDIEIKTTEVPYG